MRAALLAGKSGSLGVVILTRTFRKYGLTVSDNDPWGMKLKFEIRNPNWVLRISNLEFRIYPWDLRPTPLLATASKPAYPGILALGPILAKKERKEL